MKLPDVAETLMLAFPGSAPPPETLDRLTENPPAGFTIFSYENSVSAEQMLELTTTLQRASASELPLLIASDQEGGQLIALVGTTDFPGNMALGAAGDPGLTERIGRAIATEMLALGVNLNYAPIADLNTNPGNPSLGIRAFSDDPATAAAHVSAFVRGSKDAGVLTTVKHFPGKGEARVDSHYGLPVIKHSLRRLEAMELAPFRAGLEAGADLVMTGHFAIPGITERDDIASTLSPAVLTDLLRDDLGFAGAVITDAFDMGAIAQGAGQVIDAVAAIRAGVDLMLMTAATQERVEQGLALASHRGLISDDRLLAAVQRSRSLRRRVADVPKPDLATVGCDEHDALAREAAERAITMVRNDAGLVPLRLDPSARIAAVMPQPKDLTPADTSSRVPPSLAGALRRHHQYVDEHVVGHPPTDADIAAIRQRAEEYDLIVLGTISGSMDEQQTALARQLLDTATPVIAIALRTPYDLLAFPQAETYLCTYGIRGPSMEAAARALFGEISCSGRLPVTLSAAFPLGFGIDS
ncbi:MAG: glycoside hydrolase family 3 N-terminal domain-containing protein [Acidimicrobiia bacterium]|nr:glycoside hydrolase family 3 N-terminal domain-containing protein [Acidimicrobiia bacterium]